MFALQSLEREAQSENATMRQLAEKGNRDATSVRILTIITLIYLPCTVVSVSLHYRGAELRS
jgi:Mg2+ and Co2+ transporter CorA